MALNYSQYLEIERLLSLQTPQSDPPEHDETLFIIIHQVYELWFKQILHELDKVKIDFSNNDLYGALATLKRVRMIVKTLVAQLDVLETMTPMSFSSFRDRLDTASGFQSTQFRETEFVLGYKRKEVMQYLDPEWPGTPRVERRLAERSLMDHFYEFLEHRGATHPEKLRTKPVEDPTEPNPVIQQELLRMYVEQPDAAILFELMTDVDEGLQEWRYRHVKVVERTIGMKRGTGGSPGTDFLKKTLFRSIFPDLWLIRREM